MICETNKRTLKRSIMSKDLDKAKLTKPKTVYEALCLAEQGNYLFDWNNYTPEEFTIQLGLRKKLCIDYLNPKRDPRKKLDIYKLTEQGKMYLAEYREKSNSSN